MFNGKLVKIFTHLDILLFFAVFFGSIISEIYVCQTEPISISGINLDIFKLGKIGYSKEASENANETETRIEEEEEFTSQLTKNQSTIWELRKEILKQALHEGTQAYHLVYISIWAIIVAYFVIEIWLYCILLKGIYQRRAHFLKKWITWRFFLLIVTIGIWVYDLIGLHATCTDVYVIPFSIFRICHLFLVILYSTKIKRRDSTETIIMTGSEKL